MGAGKQKPAAQQPQQQAPRKGISGFVAAGSAPSKLSGSEDAEAPELDTLREGTKLNQELEREFEEARQRSFFGGGGRVRGGLGFSGEVKDEAGGGKRIDTTPRSTKLD